MSNEELARRAVQAICDFRTAEPFGNTWIAFATAEVLLAINAATSRPHRHSVDPSTV
jgi:hypothetical protein